MAQRRQNQLAQIVGETQLHRMVGAGHFDQFEPLRKMLAMKKQSDRFLGRDLVKQMNTIGGLESAKISSSLPPIVERKLLQGFEKSVFKQLGLGPAQKPLIEEAIKDINLGGGLSEAIRKADLYGGVRFHGALGQLKGLHESTFVGSEVLSSAQIAGLASAGGASAGIEQLVGKLRFEPGRMLAGAGLLETKGLMLGRAATLAAMRPWTINWDFGDTFTASDLVAPVKAPDDELVTAAFPPDLVEDEPLSSEFEVDVIVAEHQTGAQVFLALRSPQAARRMESAGARLTEGDAEALAQCLTSCRRALHAVADTVYPPRSGNVKDRKGNERKVDDLAFKNRLLMFLDEAIEGAKVRALAETKLDKVVSHADALLEQLNKGVHADVLRAEAKQAYVDTWAFIAHVAQVVSDD
jgi:hypothetical protein